MEKKMSFIDRLKKKLLNFLVPYIEGNKHNRKK